MTETPTPNPMLSLTSDPWGYQGRRVVVTGAASGMGRATAEILVALGAEVIGVDLAPIDIDGIAATHHVDLASAASVDAATGAIAGPIDALFNCAGVPGTADTRRILAINFCGTRRFTEQIITHMVSGASICTIGSTAAVNWPYHVDMFLELLAIDEPTEALEWLIAHLPELGYPYDVSKEALNVYTAWRATSLNEVGIRMNCVNPGATRTPASRNFTTAVKAKAGGSEMLAHWPTLMGRMARPEEQAWPMIFLNSARASFVTGASLNVDAGLTSGMFTKQHHDAVAAGMFWRPPVPAPAGHGTTRPSS